MNTPSLFDSPLETPAAWPPPLPAPAKESASTGPRWFVRCVDCLTIAAVTEQPDCYTWRCGICKGAIENMGKVERDRLTHTHLGSPCDDRCTFARGPHCDCSCGGKNHGSRLVVKIVRDAGPVPIVQMPNPEKAKRIAAEYHDYRARVLARLDTLAALKRRGEYLSDANFRCLRAIQKALRTAHAARTHEARMRALRNAMNL
jgi:hypothetical protein